MGRVGPQTYCCYILQVNVVLMRGVNDDEVCDFVELTRHRPINVRFIEYMPFDGNIWARQKLVSFKEMVSRVTEAYTQGLQPLQVIQTLERCSATAELQIAAFLSLRRPWQ